MECTGFTESLTLVIYWVYLYAVTFHRAFDMVKDPYHALEDIIRIGGIQRILTSGCERSAYEGLDTLVELSKRAQGRIIILPGAGT